MSSSEYLPAVRAFEPPTRPQDAPVKTRAERVAEDFLYGYANKNTRANYTQALKSWFGFCAGLGFDPLTGFQGEGVRRSDVEKYLRWSEEVDGKARRTCAHRFSALRGYYRRAVMDGVLDKDPTQFVKAPVVERKTTTNYLTRAELVRVLELAKKRRPRDYAIFCLLGLNGLRCGELVGLDIEHIGRDRGYTTITILRKGGFHQTLSLSQETAYAIDTIVGERQEGPLFQSLRAPYNRVSRGDVQRLVKDYARLCGITKRVSPHSFRHSFITLSLNAGVPQRDVQRSSGHADSRMTNYYDHGSDNRAREATHLLTAFVNEMM